jgi:hypothetical protein
MISQGRRVLLPVLLALAVGCGATGNAPGTDQHHGHGTSDVKDDPDCKTVEATPKATTITERDVTVWEDPDGREEVGYLTEHDRVVVIGFYGCGPSDVQLLKVQGIFRREQGGTTGAAAGYIEPGTTAAG